MKTTSGGRGSLRILYVSDAFWPYIGGIEVIAARLLPALVERGHTVAVATLHGDMPLPDDDHLRGVDIHRFALKTTDPACQLERLARSRARFRGLLKDFCPDVIHLNGLPSSALALMTPWMSADSPLLVSLHWALTSRTGRLDSWSARTLDRAAWVTACSRTVLDDARRVAAGITARSSVLSGFLPVPQTAPPPLPMNPPVLTAVSRLDRLKGLDLLIDAVALLRARWPTLRTVIAGDGHARSDLQAQAARLHLTKAVEFRGWVSPAAVWSLLDAATIVAVPSRTEGFGMAALEAGARGRPVVAAAVGGLPEALDGGRSGVLVTPENAAALADGIGRLLDNPETARAMGEHARSRVVSGKAAPGLEVYEQMYWSVAQRRSAASAIAP